MLYEGFQPLDVIGPHEVFALVGRFDASASVALTCVSMRGGSVRGQSGVSFETEPLPCDLPADLTVVIPGGEGVERAMERPDLIAAVGRIGRAATRVITICSGAMLAAEAGLIGQRRVTTHWSREELFRRRFPEIDLDIDPLYIRDGVLWSSAGVTAGVDLALAVVEHDVGPDVARLVARELVIYRHRAGGQSQFATPTWTNPTADELIRDAQRAIEHNPGADHRVGPMAARTGMSERHFARRFTDQVGVSPGRYVQRVRVEAARSDLETTADSLALIAERVGFGTAESLRRAFHRSFGVGPQQYRRHFKVAAAS